MTIVEARSRVAGAFGPSARALIEHALAHQGIEQVVGARVTAVTADGVRLEDGRLIPAATVISAVGHRPSPLTGETRRGARRTRTAEGQQHPPGTGPRRHLRGRRRGIRARRRRPSCAHDLPARRTAGQDRGSQRRPNPRRPTDAPLPAAAVCHLPGPRRGRSVADRGMGARARGGLRPRRQAIQANAQPQPHPTGRPGVERLLAAGRPDAQNNLSAFAARRALASRRLRHIVTDRTPDIATSLMAA